MRKPQRCDKYNMMKKGPWTPEEDAKLLAYVANHKIGNWTLVPDKAGLSRCGKSCRLRWTNYLRPDLKHDNFTPQEEELILDLHKAIGSRWSLIAKQLPGRTDNDVKNHWNTKLRKKLLKMGIDPITHKPFSQILTEFGNITSLPNTRNHNDSLNNFLNNSILKPEHEFTTPLMLNTEMMKQFQDSVAHFQVTQLSSPQSFPCQGSQLQTTLPSSPSSWSNYLLADPSVQTTIEQDQERELQGIKSSSYPSVSMQATSSAADSFVDTILNKDNELQSEFPELFLGGYLNY